MCMCVCAYVCVFMRVRVCEKIQLSNDRIHAGIAENLRDKFDRHRWSLIPRHIPFALFSDLLSNDQKATVAARLLAVRGSSTTPVAVPLGKPEFPKVKVGDALADFVKEESWLLLDQTAADVSWLSKPPPWDGDPDHDHVRDIVRSISGVNDCAERLCGVAKKYAVSIHKHF